MVEPGMRPTLVYAADPLCGWCFAFVEGIAHLRSELADEVDWEVACGGLVTGARVAPIADAADYLRTGMRAVEARTSARFGAAFWAVLEDGRWVSNSEPACRATLTVQDRHGGAAAVDFAGALATGFYAEGRVPDAPESLRAAARVAHVAADEILEAWDTDAARERTQRAFASARSRGLSSYPSLFLRAGAKLEPVLRGWAPPDRAYLEVRRALDERIDSRVGQIGRFARPKK